MRTIPPPLPLMIYLCFKFMIIFALSMCFHCVLLKFPIWGPQHVPNMGSSTSSQYWVLNMLPTRFLHKFPILGSQHVANMDPPQVPNGSSTCSQHWILHKFPKGPPYVPTLDPPLEVPNQSSTCSQHWILHKFPMGLQHVPNIGSST
jgi:hypothetical protein